jgi:Zn-dependent membrane protease YugP
MRQLFLQHLHPWTNLVTDYIRLGQSQGTVCDDLDPDAWVVQIVGMVISTVAAGAVASAILHENTLCDQDAQVNELLRIARISLFVNGSTSSDLGSDLG